MRLLDGIRLLSRRSTKLIPKDLEKKYQRSYSTTRNDASYLLLRIRTFPPPQTFSPGLDLFSLHLACVAFTRVILQKMGVLVFEKFLEKGIWTPGH